MEALEESKDLREARERTMFANGDRGENSFGRVSTNSKMSAVLE
jgi:hypothetical protein